MVKYVRVTNKMMTNNMLSNINSNKNTMSRLEEQYSSGKKIQRPSDDPVIAVRALRLRTNLTEVEQYYHKNVPDAQSWMDVTESSLSTINEILTKINTYCNQGANDPLTTENRESIVKNLQELKEQIYQEGNSNYAGRYVFSGYKTDTSLAFTEESTQTKYSITDHKTGQDINIISFVKGGYRLSNYDSENPDAESFAEAPTTKQAYCLPLSYQNLDEMDEDIDITYYIAAELDDEDQEPSENTVTATVISAIDEGAYEPDEMDAYIIKETGELIMGSGIYEMVKDSIDITMTYDKTSFAAGDLRPQHYFDCTTVELDEEGEPIEETATYYTTDSKYPEGQQIEYEVGFNQRLIVNTLGKDAIQHDITRTIDEIIRVVNEVSELENQMAEVDKQLEDETITEEQKEALTALKEQMNTEYALRNKMMQEAFSRGLGMTETQQDVINEALSDLGSRRVRLDLTESRLLDQKDNFTELLSTNEDADLVETVVNFNSQETIYNASLSAASKVVKNTLMNFI